MSHAALADLLAKQSITEQIYAYCRAMDRMDADLGRAVWHETGTADYGSIFKGTGHGFIDWVNKQHSALLMHSHQVTNILVKVKGRYATSESYLTVALRHEENGHLLETVSRGRYVDRWSRRKKKWAIDHRIFIYDFGETHEVARNRIDGWGRRDETDFSYAVLGA